MEDGMEDYPEERKVEVFDPGFKYEMPRVHEAKEHFLRTSWTNTHENLLQSNEKSKLSFVNAQGDCVTIWRSLLAITSMKEELEMAKVQDLFNGTVIVMLVHGGYFAGGVFKGNKCLEHKRFSRYVVRKKQGKRQSNFDKSGNSGGTVGSQMRRWNEVKHRDEIQGLMLKWASYIQEAGAIFIHAPGENRKIFTSKDCEVLAKNEHKLHTVPMTTYRPSFAEVTRVYTELSSFCLHTVEDVKIHLKEKNSIPTPTPQSQQTRTILSCGSRPQVVMPRPRNMNRNTNAPTLAS